MKTPIANLMGLLTHVSGPEHTPELLQYIHGIIVGWVEDVKKFYVERGKLRDIIVLSTLFKLTPKTIRKIYNVLDPHTQMFSRSVSTALQKSRIWFYPHGCNHAED